MEMLDSNDSFLLPNSSTASTMNMPVQATRVRDILSSVLHISPEEIQSVLKPHSLIRSNRTEHRTNIQLSERSKPEDHVHSQIDRHLLSISSLVRPLLARREEVDSMQREVVLWRVRAEESRRRLDEVLKSLNGGNRLARDGCLQSPVTLLFLDASILGVSKPLSLRDGTCLMNSWNPE
jgi:hypothetical protein